MYNWKDTRVQPLSADTPAIAIMVSEMLEHLVWRRHGIGVLQAYIREGKGTELRVHVWHPDLVLPGILESGNIHNHRFAMRSTVLAGVLEHTEFKVGAWSDGEWLKYHFPNARLHTDENRTAMEPDGVRYKVRAFPGYLGPCSYTFPSGAYHSTRLLSPIAVTLVEKRQQAAWQASVLAHKERPPVPAFSGEDLEPRKVRAILDQARSALKTLGD